MEKDVCSSVGQSYHVLLLTPHAPIVLPHPSSNKYVQHAVRQCLSDADKERGKDDHWDSEQKSCGIALPRCCYFTHACPQCSTFS